MIPTGLPTESVRAKAAGRDGYLRPLVTSHLSAIYTAADALTIFGALWAMWKLNGATAWGHGHLLCALAASSVFVVLASRRGLYRSWRVASIREECSSVMICWLLTIAVLALCALIIAFEVSPRQRPALLSWFLVGGVALAAQRVAVRYAFRSLRRAGRNYRRVAIIGATEHALHLQRKIENSAWMGMRMQGIYDDRRAAPDRIAAFESVGNMESLLRSARAGEVDVVYIALPLHAVEAIRRKILALMDTTVSVYLVPDMFVFGLLDSQVSYVDDIPVFTVAESPFVGIEGWGKRLEDLVIGSLIMAVIAIPMLAIAIAVKSTSPGPVFFRQKRYGLDGRPIAVWKFRSMTVTEDGATVFQQATKGDSRITPLGSFLRRTSLDELPQFINVLHGSMSIVGPRPHPVMLNESFRRLIPGYMLRHKVKPGITGWAQVNGWRGETDTLQKMEGRVEFDLDYVRRWSVWFDLKIIGLTILRGFTGNNAY